MNNKLQNEYLCSLTLEEREQMNYLRKLASGIICNDVDNIPEKWIPLKVSRIFSYLVTKFNSLSKKEKLEYPKPEDGQFDAFAFGFLQEKYIVPWKEIPLILVLQLINDINIVEFDDINKLRKVEDNQFLELPENFKKRIRSGDVSLRMIF